MEIKINKLFFTKFLNTIKKTLTLIAVGCLFSTFVTAQDKIVLKNGEELNVKILQNSGSSVFFQYPNETLTNEKSKREIKYILFSSGRKEECNQGITIPTIKSKDDWKQVVVTYLPEDVEGLTRVSELKATSSKGGVLGSSMGYKGAINKLKRKAAKLGAGVLLIHGSPNSTAAAWGGGVQVVGTAYK